MERKVTTVYVPEEHEHVEGEPCGKMGCPDFDEEANIWW